MDSALAVRRLSALAQDNRLAVFRLLVQAGPIGVSVGEIARELEIIPNTLSAQLAILTNAGLVTARRNGRSIYYAANYPAMSALVLFLMEDCCKGRSEIWRPVAEAVLRGASCESPEGAIL